ncbi:PKD [Methanospirillum hungatei JF-1]|uniref:PKD n=1 Tax=Methanospirillum hungatei JF-1 (strain ATCC 27890 / DSM 864 / NBRC 100397 / JF-1) TaxID=323259 RepID=Q2FSN4_METHJ|nr:PEGA domain-containing protein [Methanospirillum hungatei]ABD42198.1 PKD [Methanospirillum hungatei JF-1]
MKNKFLTSILTICMVSLFLCGTVCADKVSLEDIGISTVGQKVELPVLLDSAPGGIAGYKFTTSFAPAGIAQVSSVTMPEWAGIKVVEGAPGEKVLVSALDLEMKVEAGTGQVQICTLGIEGLSEGVATLTLNITEITDDNGNPISVELTPATITVGSQTAAPVPVQTPQSSSTQVPTPEVTPEIQENTPVVEVTPTVTPTPVPTVVADFTAQLQEGSAPMTVFFTDNSTGYPTKFMWNFGDGSSDNTSPLQNPQHIYRIPGVYTVSLTASNSEYTNTTEKAGFITVKPMHLPVRGAKNNVTIFSVPDGAEVYLNNAYQGVTPAFLTNLTSRDYQLRLHKEGYYDVVSPISILDDVLPTFISGFVMMPHLAEIGELSANPPQTGAAYIVSYPELVNVTIDDTPVGKTDIMVMNLAVGMHNLTLQKEGYEPWNDTLEIKNGLAVIQTYHYEEPYFSLNRTVEYVQYP